MSGAPIGVTVSTTPSGQIVLVANGTKSQILVFSTSGTLQRTISSTGTCTINRARDAAADSSGDIYVANYESNDILEFSSSGACIRSWGTHGKQEDRWRLQRQRRRHLRQPVRRRGGDRSLHRRGQPR